MGSKKTLETNIRKTKSGKYEVTYYYPAYATDTGKSDRDYEIFDGITEAKKALRLHKKNVKEGKAKFISKKNKLTLEKTIDEYISKRNIAETTAYGYRSCVKYISQHSIYRMNVTEMRKSDIDAYIKFLCTEHPELSKNTINHHLDLIRASLNYAQLNDDNLNINVIKRIVNLKHEKFIGKRYTNEEVEKLENALETYPDMRVVVAAKLGLYLGLRRGEICGLKWENIDFDNKLINIKQTVTYAGHSLEKAPKSIASIRTLGLPEQLVDVLKEYKIHQEECLDFFKKDAYSQKLEFVLVSDNLKPVRPNYVSGLWKKFLEENNLKPMRFHDLRHNFISWGYEKGMQPLELAAVAGHGGTKMVNQIYAHLGGTTVERSKEIANFIANKK